MKYILCDTNQELCKAWILAFKDVEDVAVISGSIFDLKVDAIVSPANSFGFMDGGLDYLISKNMGWDIQKNLQQTINDEYNGELLVGQACVIPTTHTIPFVISAPTMRVPTFIGRKSINVYLASKAIFNCVNNWNTTNEQQINTVAIPGLGTGTGRVPYDICANQMLKAYLDVKYPVRTISLKEVTDRHYFLQQ